MRNYILVLAGIGLGVAATCLPLRPTAEAAPLQAGGEAPETTLVVGGAGPDTNDLCWLLVREKSTAPNSPPERYVLCLYRVLNGGQGFDLADVREVTYDMKATQLKVPGHNPAITPQAMKKAYEDAIRQQEAQPQRNP